MGIAFADPWWHRAAIIEVHDGDTYNMHVDLGFKVYTDGALRLLGVNTPELPTPEGYASRDWVNAWFVQHTHKPGRWPFFVHTQRDVTSYNRYIASVFCLKGHSLAADIIEAGMGVGI